MLLRLFVFVFCAALVASQACPNDCSQHGTCTAGQCVCSANWGGFDCSVSDQLLVNGVVTHDVVGTREWRYFHIDAHSDRSDLVIEVNQTSTSGDCDTYVREGNYPTRQSYDYRDIGTQKNARLLIPHPNGLYYVGVYGFLGADFDIRATVKTDCPNDCSGHGRCLAENTCECNQGWTGGDCSLAITVMTNNTVYTGEVQQRNWSYYSFNNARNTMQIDVTQTGGPSEDCDLYVKFGELPGLSNFDYRDTTVSQQQTLKVTNAQQGNYMIGVYGFKQCHYNIKAISFNECPNQCSGRTHGVCSTGTTCRCNARFSGDSCESMITPLSYDAPMTGFVDESAWNYYHFTPRSSSNILVNLVEDDPTMDCDLYIRRNEEPTRFAYDYRDISFKSNFTITIENPYAEPHYIGVYGYKSCSYTLTTHVTKDCPNSCVDKNHGTCQDGHCLCTSSWTGEDCSIPINTIPLDSTILSSVPANDWKYFSFTAQAHYQVTILMHELNSTGFLWLYESRDSFPSMAAYDHSDTETNSATHDIVFTPESQMLVQVGVFGSPLTVPGQTYGFKIVAWQASFDGARREILLREM